MSQLEEYRQKIDQIEQQDQQIRREIITQTADFSKQKALLDQKIDHLENQLKIS